MCVNYNIAIFSFNHHQNLLPYTIKSIKQHLKNYTEIVVVWDDYVRERPVDFDKIRSITDENFRVVLQSEIYNWPKKIGEWGWIKQQLAKMLCYSYMNGDRTYIVDGDVIFTGDPVLFNQNKLYLRQDKSCKVPEDYKFFIQKYLGMDKFSEHTYVGSTCMFEHDVLKYVLASCVEKNKKTLINCVNEIIESEDHPDYPFSEFEIYGHIANEYFADRFILAEKNWAYPDDRNSKQEPIQIMWADNESENLEQIYSSFNS